MINSEEYIDEIKRLMLLYPQYGIDPNYIELVDNSCLNIATAVSGINETTGEPAKGIRIKKLISNNDIASAKGAIGFNKKKRECDRDYTDKAWLLDTDKKFFQHLILHEIAHHTGYSQDDEFNCDIWAFNEMERMGLL
jgi:hypothetical protein